MWASWRTFFFSFSFLLPIIIIILFFSCEIASLSNWLSFVGICFWFVLHLFVCLSLHPSLPPHHFVQHEQCMLSLWFLRVVFFNFYTYFISPIVCKTRSSSNASLTSALTSSVANCRCYCCVYVWLIYCLRHVSFRSLFSRAVALFIVMDQSCWCCLSFV